MDSHRTDPETNQEDVYLAQREELLQLLKSLSSKNEPLVVHGRALLSPDEMSVVLQKIKSRHSFSRRERSALSEAGFLLEKLFPNL